MAYHNHVEHLNILDELKIFLETSLIYGVSHCETKSIIDGISLVRKLLAKDAETAKNSISELETESKELRQYCNLLIKEKIELKMI